MESTDTLMRDRVTDVADLADGALLSEATEIEALLREAEIHKLRIAYQWAIAHPAIESSENATHGGASVLAGPLVAGPFPTNDVAVVTTDTIVDADENLSQDSSEQQLQRREHQ